MKESRDEVLRRYDREMRLTPEPVPGVTAERVGPVVRSVGTENYVIWSDLNTSNARAVVAEQAAFFRSRGVEAEWKLFGHDRPDDLPAILAAEGFVPEEPETLVVFDLAEGTPGSEPGSGVTVRPVSNGEELRAAWEANRKAFEDPDPPSVERWREMWKDPAQVLFVAYADGVAVSSGRLTLPPARSFAGLYGGGTVAEFRHRGIYRALVRARATMARERGYRYLTVDARETSRPILERLGFEPLTTTRPWILRPPEPRTE
jgi:GNAT superfamily N-acetyltransferase